MKLKTKASVVMAVTVVLALTTIGGAFHLFLEKSLRAPIADGLVGVAQASSELIHRFITDGLRDARAVAVGMPPEIVARRDVEAAQAYLAGMCAVFTQFDNGLFILDAEGRLWADYPPAEGVRGRSFAFRDYYQRTLATGQGVLGQPYQSARSKEPVCTFTAPLLGAKGEPLGLVGCSVKLLSQESLGMLRQQAIGKSGYLYVIDQSRLMILHPVQARILQRDIPPGANQLLDRAINGFEGVDETVNSRGVPMFTAFKQVPQTNWVLAVQQPREEAMAPLKEMQTRLLAGIALGALLAVLVGLLVIRSITKPVSDLRRATESLGREPFDQAHAVLARGDEIGELARSFRDISQNLRQNFAELSETERRLKDAQAVAHIGSWELDLSTREVWGSEEAGRITGMGLGLSTRLPLEQTLATCLPADRPRLEQAWAALLAGQAEYGLDYRIRRSQDGEVRVIHSQAHLIPGRDGGPDRVVGTIQDITERQRAEADIRRRSEELTALNALGRDLNRDLSLRHTVAAALRGVAESLRPDMTFLFLREGDRLVFQDSLPLLAGEARSVAKDHQVGQCVCGLAAQRREALFSPDIHADQRCTWSECKAAGIRSFAAVPLLGGGEVIGVMGLASMSERDFQTQAAFLETLASQVSVAIANARLFEKVQDELAQHQTTLAALRESQDRYRALSDESPLGISLIGQDDRYEYLNPAFVDIFGYTLEDIPTRARWFERAYPDPQYRQEVMAAWAQDAQVSQPGQVVVRTLKIATKAGVPKDILLRVVPLPSGGHFIIYEDVSERLRAEESLRHSEERFRRLIEGLPIAIAVTGPDQTMEYVNNKFTETLGYDINDVPDLGVWWVKAYPDPDYRQEVMETWLNRVEEAHKADSEVEPVERRVRCKDGSDKIVAFYGAPVGGKTLVVLLDVTAQRAVDCALQESEARFRRFVEASPLGVHMFRYEAPDRLVFSGYNPAAERILGRDHRPLLGKVITEAFPAVAGTDIPAQYLRVAREGVIWRDDEISYEQGRVSSAYEVTAFQTGQGDVAAVFNDITERLRVQEDLRILEQQLVRSQKLEALGTLASGIAHDFNNILQALRGRAELLASDDELPEPTRLHIGNMQRSIQRATQLVARMLSFGRSGEARLSVLDLNREVLLAVEMLKHALPRMVAIETQLAPGEGFIKGDANRLEQLILNLATNARDAMPDGGTLLFKTRYRLVRPDATPDGKLPQGEYVVLEVSDNGQGMDSKTLGRIFEPFFSTKEAGKGTGLGLYSAYGIVREHGGTITCQSRPGHGTTFTMLFPWVGPPPAEASAKTETEALVSAGGESLLVVDDEPEILAPLCEALAGHGYQVRQASSGEEAIAHLAAPGAKVDLVLMDLNMPGMGGEKALTEIKAGHPEIRVIVASGYQDRTLKEKVLTAGADHFIGKPFDFKELLMAVREILARGGRSAN